MSDLYACRCENPIIKCDHRGCRCTMCGGYQSYSLPEKRMKLDKEALAYANDAVSEALDAGGPHAGDLTKLAIQAYLQSVARQAVPDSEVHRWARKQTRASMKALWADAALVKSVMEDMIGLCHGASVACGWYDDLDGEPIQRNFGERIALVHSEVSEALEGHRKDKQDDHLKDRKSVEVELADALIRIFDMAGHLGLDLSGAFIEKGLYNLRREDHTLAHRKAEGGKVY